MRLNRTRSLSVDICLLLQSPRLSILSHLREYDDVLRNDLVNDFQSNLPGFIAPGGSYYSSAVKKGHDETTPQVGRATRDRTVGLLAFDG